jgi:hypothetical protein
VNVRIDRDSSLWRRFLAGHSHQHKSASAIESTT